MFTPEEPSLPEIPTLRRKFTHEMGMRLIMNDVPAQSIRLAAASEWFRDAEHNILLVSLKSGLQQAKQHPHIEAPIET
ncbi:hypothetical protein BA190_08800 [Labrys sp. WJW]|uniref:hypothetical protein n=1 Tax=Labrys sp. WJW TaxID=1737983 RepID=UPI00082C2783|nr:hypothetical protein [Labrys sp. WJW]OCC05496.1 hypothetical protein BA190_08800 [Labrys sp. WJW]